MAVHKNRPVGLYRVLLRGIICSFLATFISVFIVFGLPELAILETEVMVRTTEECNNCFKYDFKYKYHNENLCKTFGKYATINILFLIFTTAEHSNRRRLIRETWMSKAIINKLNVRYAFLLGNSKQSSRALRAESYRFKDIIQGNFNDSYDKLTFKTLMALQWAVSWCKSARFIFKADDDMFVNVPAILHQTLHVHGQRLQTAVGGLCWQKQAPHRDKSSKYFVPREMYPDSSYPSFCSGTGYLTGMNVAEGIYKASKDISFFPLEDVFVGMCLQKLGYLTFNISGFYNIPIPFVPCDVITEYVLTSHSNSMSELRTAWNEKCVENNYLTNYTFNFKTKMNLT